MASSFLTQPANADQDTVAQPRIWIYTACLLAFVPLLQSVMTWTYDGQLTSQQFLIRLFSLTTTCAEIGILLIAGRVGFEYKTLFSGLPKATKILLAVWGVCALAALFLNTAHVQISAFVLARYALQGLTLAAIIHMLRTADHFEATKWFGLLALGGLAYIILLTYFAITVPNPRTFPWEGGLPSATSVRHIGNYVVILAIAPAALLLFANKPRKWHYAIAFAAMTMFAAWTGSRAAVLGLVLSLISGWFFMRRDITRGKIAALGFAFFGGIVASIPLPIPNPSYGLLRMFDALQPGVEISSGRIEAWLHTIHEIAKQPFLGHGTGRFANNMSELYGLDLDNPHNFILQYFYDWGVIGGAAGLALLFMLGRAVFQQRGKEPMLVFAAIAGITILFTIGLLEGMLYHPMKMFLVMAMIAPVFAAKRETP